MRPDGSLRARITFAIGALAFVICSLFAAAVYFTVEALETNLFTQYLSEQAASLIERHRSGKSYTVPPRIGFYHDATIPEALARLAPGYREVTLDERNVHVLTRADEHGRFVITIGESDFERIEGHLYIALGVGVAISLLLSIWLGWITASRVIAPVTALADAVQREDREGGLPSLDAPDEIGALARAFARRTDELQGFLVRERLFTGDVSHELRTPLTVILGAAELIAAQSDDRPSVASAVERIQRAADDMSDKVGAFLLLSRAPEALDAPLTALRPLIEREFDRCRVLVAAKPVSCRLDIREDVWVNARPELAAVAVGNLLRNACQYTKRGEVLVCLESSRLIVEDTGPGLPEPVRARLFEPSVRVRHEQPEGSGLGLAIVQRIAAHLRWGFGFEMRPEGGSRFILNFSGALTKS
jgi:signal transduction histidine kinase